MAGSFAGDDARRTARLLLISVPIGLLVVGLVGFVVLRQSGKDKAQPPDAQTIAAGTSVPGDAPTFVATSTTPTTPAPLPGGTVPAATVPPAPVGVGPSTTAGTTGTTRPTTTPTTPTTTPTTSATTTPGGNLRIDGTLVDERYVPAGAACSGTPRFRGTQVVYVINGAGTARLANSTFSACAEVEPGPDGTVRARLSFSVTVAAANRQGTYAVEACTYRSGAFPDPGGAAATIEVRAPDDASGSCAT